MTLAVRPGSMRQPTAAATSVGLVRRLATLTAAAILLTGCASAPGDAQPGEPTGSTGAAPTTATSPPATASAPTSPSSQTVSSIESTSAGSSSAPGPSSPHTTSSGPATSEKPADSPAEPVITVTVSRYTIAGSQGTEVTTVLADGSVSEVDEKSMTITRWAMAPASLRSLLEQAETDGLMGSPKPGFQATDSGSLTLTIDADGKRSTIELTGLGHQTADPVYRATMKLVDRIAQRSQLGIEEQPVSSPVDSALLIAQASDAEVITAEAWPLPTPAKKLFAESACVLLRGADLQALVQRMGSSPGQAMTFGTGDRSVPALTLRMRLAPATPPQPHCERQNENMPVAAWPGTTRTPTTTWQYWIANRHLQALKTLAGKDFRPSGYGWSLYTATVGGKQVLDAHGRSLSPGSGDQPEVVELRLDAATGKVLASVSQTG